MDLQLYFEEGTAIDFKSRDLLKIEFREPSSFGMTDRGGEIVKGITTQAYIPQQVEQSEVVSTIVDATSSTLVVSGMVAVLFSSFAVLGPQELFGGIRNI